MLPNRKYLIQKAVLRDDVLKASAARLSAVPNEYFLQRKYDGCNTIAILPRPGVCQLYSRTGTPVKSMDHVAQQLLLQFGQHVTPTNGIVVLGEAWQEDTAFPAISGNFRRQSASPSLTLVLFDILPYEAFLQGFYDVPYSERYTRLVASQNGCLAPLPVAVTYNPGTWGGDSKAMLADLMARHPVGYDGIILRDSGGWAAGDGRTGGILKEKQVIEHDLLVVGTEEGLSANAGKIGALVCQYKDGTTVAVGTGLSRQERETDPALFIGKVVLVEAMGYTESSLREPRYKGVRYDKETPDF